MADPTCDHCHQVPAGNLLRCSKCTTAFYCSAACQKAAWKAEHKPICNAFTAILAKSSAEADLRATLASKRIESIEDTCAICLDPPQTPVVLDCNHVFCGPCLTQFQNFVVVNDGNIVRKSCPTCRTPLNESNFPQFVYQKATTLIQRANRLDPSVGVPMTPEDAHYISIQEGILFYCKLAKDELAKVEGLAQQRAVRSLLVGILLLEKQFAQVVVKAEELISEIATDAVSIDVRKMAAKACIALGKYDNAHGFLVGAFQYTDSNDNASIREILSLMCAVEYNRKDYGKAIEYGEMVIHMNRHFHGCYDYVILSHLALGHKEQVEGLVKQCKLYETPWDSENKKRVEKFCAGVLAQP
ncbi:UNVERIFIED_CONTAM: Tripartite motif-containing protein 26 [Siphonaria sp. JEL0065]|nr:Tripartite motif-containing protein 26 [Siphonaria sp. JEL0065]